MERASWRPAGTRARGALSLSCTGVGFAPFPLRIFAESFDNVGSASEDGAESHRETLDKRTKRARPREINLRRSHVRVISREGGIDVRARRKIMIQHKISQVARCRLFDVTG